MTRPNKNHPVYNAYVDVQQYSSHDIWSRRLMSGVWWASFNFGSNTIPAQQKPSLGTFTFPIHVHHFGGYIRSNQQLSLFNSMIIVDSFGFVQHMVIIHCGLAPIHEKHSTLGAISDIFQIKLLRAHEVCVWPRMITPSLQSWMSARTARSSA